MGIWHSVTEKLNANKSHVTRTNKATGLTERAYLHDLIRDSERVDALEEHVHDTSAIVEDIKTIVTELVATKGDWPPRVATRIWEIQRLVKMLPKEVAHG